MFDCNFPGLGDTIYYKLRPIDNPTDPNKEWEGRVIKAYPPAYVEVELLEEGYEECTEIVMQPQITRIATHHREQESEKLP